MPERSCRSFCGSGRTEMTTSCPSARSMGTPALADGTGPGSAMAPIHSDVPSPAWFGTGIFFFPLFQTGVKSEQAPGVLPEGHPGRPAPLRHRSSTRKQTLSQTSLLRRGGRFSKGSRGRFRWASRKTLPGKATGTAEQKSC